MFEIKTFSYSKQSRVPLISVALSMYICFVKCLYFEYNIVSHSNTKKLEGKRFLNQLKESLKHWCRTLCLLTIFSGAKWNFIYRKKKITFALRKFNRLLFRSKKENYFLNFYSVLWKFQFGWKYTSFETACIKNEILLFACLFQRYVFI